LIFYSDGITEAENAKNEEFGTCHLADHAARSEASAVSLLDEVRTFANGSGVRDDASAVFIAVNL